MATTTMPVVRFEYEDHKGNRMRFGVIGGVVTLAVWYRGNDKPNGDQHLKFQNRSALLDFYTKIGQELQNWPTTPPPPPRPLTMREVTDALYTVSELSPWHVPPKWLTRLQEEHEYNRQGTNSVPLALAPASLTETLYCPLS